MIMFAMRFIAFCYVGLRCGGGCGGVPFNVNTAEIFRHTNHPFIPGQSPPESLIHPVRIRRVFVTLFFLR